MIDCPSCKGTGVVEGTQSIQVGSGFSERKVEQGCQKCGGSGHRADKTGKDSWGFAQGSGKLNCDVTVGDLISIPGLKVLGVHPQRSGGCAVEIGYGDEPNVVHLLTVDSKVVAKK